MSLVHLIILAIVQGLTEFLPISSSAHLILPAQILGWDDQGPLIDVMAHFGSLFAVLLFFRSDVGAIISGFFDLSRKRLNRNSMLALNLIIATPPALLFGAFLTYGGWDIAMRTPLIIALTSIVFGVLLWIADIKGKRVKTVEDLTWKEAAMLGFAQALALIPGTSRSGVTMTAARAMGYNRFESARFSMLMSLPIIGAGGLFSLIKLAEGPSGSASLTDGLIVAGLSFITAYLAIAAFMRFVSRIGMFPFMIYRVLLGSALLIWIILQGV